ncbi:MAG: sodium/solute symporter [Kiritimatiellae bacterium]|nr:sodium/solute symporter [Kiritimatiellia bacterium]
MMGTLRPIDLAIVILYLAGVAAAGFVFAHGNRSSDAYFKGGGKLPWWAVSLSLFAALFSPLSFLAIPALVYSTDMSYLPIFFGVAIVLPVTIRWYIPFFRTLNVTSAYEYLEVRFNLLCRMFASAAFILFMVSLTAIVAYLPSVALSAVTGMDVNVAIVAVILCAIAYGAAGGISAIVWIDFLQSLLLFGAMAAIVTFLVSGTDGGLSGCIAKGMDAGKFRAFDMALDWTRPTFWVVLIGGTVANFASYTSDQRVVQRYLTVKDVKAAARSMYLQVVVSVITSTLLFFTGVALWTYYASQPGGMPELAKNDQILPVFIANGLPAGVAGCALAAIAAATLSTLAANLNSTAAAFTTDFYRRLVLKGRKDERRELMCGKVCTVLAGLLGGGFAIVLANGDLASAYEQFQRYIGMLTAGLGALFFMGIFMKCVNGFGAVCGLAANYAVTFGLDLLPWPGKPHMLLYGFFGMTACLAVAMLASRCRIGFARGLVPK